MPSGDIDDAFGALDGDGDGKVTKSELTDAMTKLSDQLNAQFDASRVNGGGMRPDGPPPGPPPGGASGANSADATASTASTTEPADSNGDGTVSAQEQAAYETKQASESGRTQHERDPMREFAHALQLLKAYSADNDTASASSSVSVEA
jgi:hypothetical protein